MLCQENKRNNDVVARLNSVLLGTEALLEIICHLLLTESHTAQVSLEL